MNGFFCVDKEENWTSRDVCNKIQSLFHIKKVGHAGTLDPFATGLLLVGVGSMTKALSYIENEDKEYIASLTLGKKTNTADITGEVIEEKDIPIINKEDIEKVFQSLLGPQKQLPPMTSAVHVNGVKLYKLAHQGKEIERPLRDIEIKELKLLSFDKEHIIFSCLVSKGTYIRTLGETIAEKLNTVGYLDHLNRTKIGKISLKQAKKINELTEKDVLSLSSLVSMKKFIVKDEEKKKVLNGMTLIINHLDEDNILVVDENDTPLAVYKQQLSHHYKCERGLWS